MDLGSPVQEIFDEIVPKYFDPHKGHCDWGHEGEHLRRMLAMRRAWWDDIVADEPNAAGLALPLDLAILFHDLDRSKELAGHDDEKVQLRCEAAWMLMSKHGVDETTAAKVFLAMEKKGLRTGHAERTILARLLSDFDKADMGAVGIYRMAAVASARGYGIFVRAEDFNLESPAIEGDENLDSFAADIKFCLEWWTNPKFAIETSAIRRRAEHKFRFMLSFLAQLQTEHAELGFL